MSKLTNIILMSLATLLCAPLAMQAQVAPRCSLPAGCSPATAERARLENEQRHPFLSKCMTLRSPKASALWQAPFTDKSIASTVVDDQRQVEAPLNRADKVKTLWGDVNNLNEWGTDKKIGYYSFPTSGQLSFTALGLQSVPIAKNGVQISNGRLYGAYLNTEWADYGIYSLVLSNYDLDTWKGTSTDGGTDYDLVAVETAQAADGTVYGEFYTKQLSGLEWGTVDYTTRKRTYIADASRIYVALGITRAGQLYGIATDGYLYKINKASGEETQVGPTGVKVSNDAGNYYGQTGEIDQTDDTFYWACIDADGKTGLYTVDLATGKATKTGTYTGQIFGMVIPQPEALDDAPAKVSDVACNFEGSSLQGNVSFTCPSKTYAGATLSGTLSYTVTANGSVVASGSAQAGEKVTASVTLPASGNYKFNVTTANAVGTSPSATSTHWVGFDQPEAPAGLTATLGSNNQVTVKWTAPTAGIHNGYIGQLTYEVKRVNATAGQSTTVATSLDGTEFTDQIPDGPMASYQYQVAARNGDTIGSPATSNAITVGSAIEPDWTCLFDKQADFNLFTVLDVNNDKRTWGWNADGSVTSNYSMKTGNDDWLITPAIHLDNKYLYTFSFKGKERMAKLPNTLEVKMGTSPTASGMTTTLQETTTLTGDWQVYSYVVRPVADGNYYFGFHDNTAVPKMFYLMIDSVSVARGSLLTAPDTVSDYSVVSGEHGALQATISFAAPATRINGNAIDKLDSICLMRDGQLIHKWTDIMPKQACTFTDDAVGTDGFHTYSVVAYRENQQGLTSSKKTFVGYDQPNMPENVVLFDNNGKVTAKWDKPAATGVNGGYIDTEKLSVSIFATRNSDWGTVLGDSITTSEPGKTQVSLNSNADETTSADGKTQALIAVAARANTLYGNSNYTVSKSMVVGAPLRLPFKESFSNLKLDNGLVWIEGNQQINDRSTASIWKLTDEISADNDGGAALWAPVYEGNWMFNDILPGDELSINLPKVSLQGSTNPQLFFQLYAKKNEQAKLAVIVMTPEGEEHAVDTIDLRSTKQDGWSRQQVSLKDFSSQRYVIVKLKGICEGEDTYIGLDRLQIVDQLSDNLAATAISVPARVKASNTATVDVTVENQGAKACNDYEVSLFADGKLVNKKAISAPLAVMCDTTISLPFNVKVNSSAKLELRALVHANVDMDRSNDTTSNWLMEVRPSRYATVNDLNGTSQATGVALNWGKPVFDDFKSTTETFDDYTPFATEFGDWKLVDVDKALALGFGTKYNFPLENKPYAFMVFNPDAMTSDFVPSERHPGLAAHSGKQYAASSHQYKNGNYADADNWLISPSLSGKAQTVTFYVSNITRYEYNTGSNKCYKERFDVLTSTTTDDVTSFTKLTSDVADGTNEVEVGNNWKQITVNLPEGSRYFAIHHDTPADSCFVFGIDDISYQEGPEGAIDTIVGFNIYRDGELLATVAGNEHNYVDKTPETGHVYNVTVLYKNAKGEINESEFSNSVSLTSSVVELERGSNATTFDVFTIDGRQVMQGAKNLSGLSPGLYIVNGKKYVKR